MNALTGKAQVIDLNPGGAVVWYTPEGFPDVETDADLIDGDGDLLLISNGWMLKIISAQQVTRVHSSRFHGWQEIGDEERVAYNQEHQS